jgi:hypothetical protein
MAVTAKPVSGESRESQPEEAPEETFLGQGDIGQGVYWQSKYGEAASLCELSFHRQAPLL